MEELKRNLVVQQLFRNANILEEHFPTMEALIQFFDTHERDQVVNELVGRFGFCRVAVTIICEFVDEFIANGGSDDEDD